MLGSAPRLAQVVAMRPHVLDAAIDPARTLDFDFELADEAMGARVETVRVQGRSARMRSTWRATSPPRRRLDIGLDLRGASTRIGPARVTAPWRRS